MSAVTRRRMLTGLTGGAIALGMRGPVGVRGQQPIDRVQFAWNDSGMPNPFQVSPAGPRGPILVSLLYDTLTWKDQNGIIPWLASEWSASDDALTYSLRIVPGVTWHDGNPLTADDVAFSFDYYARHPYVWMGSDVIESTTADGDTVEITLHRPYAPFLEDIAGILPIIPRHVWDAVDDPIAYAGEGRTVGSGPYSLAEYNETEGAYRLIANDGYWRGTPLIAELRFLNIPAEALIPATQQGDVDVTPTTDASVLEIVANDERLIVHESAPLSIARLAVNTKREPLDRKEVRQAIAYAIDRELLAESITRGPAVVGSAGVVPPETPWFNPNLKLYNHDPDQARDLLGGERFTFDLVVDANARDPEIIVPMLAEAGITLNVQGVDAATRIQLLRDGDFDLGLLTHIGVGGDPDYLRRWYSGEETNAFAQGSIFENAEYTRLADAQAVALDVKQRRDIVFDMQHILAEELPTIVLYHRRFYWVHDPELFAPVETWGGLMNGIPFPHNKLALIAT